MNQGCKCDLKSSQIPDAKIEREKFQKWIMNSHTCKGTADQKKWKVCNAVLIYAIVPWLV